MSFALGRKRKSRRLCWEPSDYAQHRLVFMLLNRCESEPARGSAAAAAGNDLAYNLLLSLRIGVGDRVFASARYSLSPVDRFGFVQSFSHAGVLKVDILQLAHVATTTIFTTTI